MSTDKPKIRGGLTTETKTSTLKGESGMLIMDYKIDKLWELNESATVIYQMCNGENAVEDIIAAMSKRYAADESEVERDVRNFMKELDKYGLLE
jgi:coenzyme PQQ biosynthesis protein PqqD